MSDQIIIREFGNRVRNAREQAGLTQLDLAVKAEIDIRQIQRIENSENATSIINAYRIAKTLDVHIQKLFDFEI